MKSVHQERVEEFMEKAGQEIPQTPTIPDEKTRILRAKLIMEEALETIKGLGVAICVDDRVPYEKEEVFECPLRFEWLIFTTEMTSCRPNLIEIADGCADISVVTIGTLSACGISDISLLEEVDESNLRKFGSGGHLREDGKYIKPDDWQPPNIQGVLVSQSKK